MWKSTSFPVAVFLEVDMGWGTLLNERFEKEKKEKKNTTYWDTVTANINGGLIMVHVFRRVAGAFVS